MRWLRKVAGAVAAVAVPIAGLVETGALVVGHTAASVITGVALVATTLAPSLLPKPKSRTVVHKNGDNTGPKAKV